MNNLLSYCGLVIARISASEKDLPVNIKTIRTIAQIFVAFSGKLNFTATASRPASCSSSLNSHLQPAPTVFSVSP
jgi:hypothetical protein